MDRAEREAAELAWVDRNRPMVESAAQDFLETGEWPTVEVMQRRMDRLRNGIEVQRALEEMPRFPGEVGGMYWTNVTVPIRMFKHIPGGRNLLPVCLSLVQLSMDVWLSDAEPPSISNTDPELRSIMPGRAPEVWLRAAQLLQASQPSPLAGGGYGPDGWSYIVNGSFVRRLSDILTIDDFFDAQQEVMEDAEAQRSGAAHEAIAAPTRHSVFVLMPFTETWSDSGRHHGGEWQRHVGAGLRPSSQETRSCGQPRDRVIPV